MRCITRAATVLCLFVAACGGKDEPPPEDPSDEVDLGEDVEPEAEFIETGPGDEQDGADSTATVDAPAAAGAGDETTGHPCDRYAACCHAYIDALTGVDGVPQATIDAAKQACDAIDEIKGSPDDAEACQQGFDALVQGVEAMMAMPGFVRPDACQGSAGP